MHLFRTATFAVCMMASLLGTAQRVKLREGDLSALKGITKMNLQFDYGSFTVGKNKKEADYVAARREEYNRKEAGKGDKWADSWVMDRQSRFEPQFIEEFEKQSGIRISTDLPMEKYSIIFRTTHVEPGFNIGITRKNAEIDGEAWIIENSNSEHVIAKISVENCPGRTFGGYDFDTGQRISEAYAVAGKGLGKFLNRKR